MRCATSRHPRGRAGGLAALGAVAAAGCAVGPDFQRPAVPPESAYITAADAGTAAARRLQAGAELGAAWWQLFHCTPLEEAVQAALRGSPTLRAANATLAQAQEQVAVARGALLPHVNAAAGAQHAVSGNPVPQAPNTYSLGLSAVYTLDVFGGARRSLEQQGALAEAQRFQLAAAWLTLTGGVVTQALTVASTRLQLSTTQELIASDRRNLELTQREFEVGTAAKSDVLTADSQLAADLTQLPTLEQQLAAARDALAVLTGRAPVQWPGHDFDIGEFVAPTQIPLALPAQLARRRPDVLAAEAQLHAASAAVGVAKADEFPNFELSAAVTRSALQAGGLFHDFDTLRSAGGSLSAPLFAGGALRAQTRAARDAYRAQAATYESVVIEALGQVTDDLWALQHDVERLSVFRHSVDIASQALKLQQDSYKAGKSNILQLIDAQRSYAQARLGLATAQVQQLQDTAGLLVALGGGWWTDPAAQGAATTGTSPAAT